MVAVVRQCDSAKGFFRQVMGYFTTGVAIVTANHQGILRGLTVNAFCSVSLDPLLILVCINGTSTTVPLIRESRIFAVNILTDKQEYLSRAFATASQERLEYFYHTPYSVAATGAPILDDVLAFIDARVVAEYPGGDHVIFLGQVAAIGTTDHVVFVYEADSIHSTLVKPHSDTLVNNASPLAYYRGQYWCLTR